MLKRPPSTTNLTLIGFRVTGCFPSQGISALSEAPAMRTEVIEVCLGTDAAQRPLRAATTTSAGATDMLSPFQVMHIMCHVATMLET